MKYHFTQESSLIKDLEVYKEGGIIQAKIVAPDDASSLEKTKQILDGLGYRTLKNVDTTPEGRVRTTLTLHNTEGAEQLIRDLYRYQIVEGDYSATLTEKEQKENKSLKQWVDENVLSIAGALYVTADSFVLASGAIRGDLAEIFNGVLWLIPNMSLIAAGHQDPNKVLGFMKRDFLEELERNQIAIPADVRAVLEHRIADHNLGSQVTELIYRYGPIINNAMELLGGSQMLAAGLRQENWGKAAAGSLVVTGMTMGIVLKEKTKAEQEVENLGVGHLSNPEAYHGNAVGVAQQGAVITPKEKSEGFFANITPQWWPGKLGILNNILNLTGAVNELRSYYGGMQDGGEVGFGWRGQRTERGGQQAIHNKNWYDNQISALQAERADVQERIAAYNPAADRAMDTDYQKLLTEESALSGRIGQYEAKGISAKASFCNLAAGSIFLIANNFYAHSRKENHANLNAINALDTMYSIAANIVVAQPEERHEIMTDRLAVLLAQSKYIHGSIDHVSQKISEKVDHLTASKHAPTATLIEVQPDSRQRMLERMEALVR